MNIGRPHFVWERTGHGRPQPVKVYELDFGVNGWKRDKIVACHELSDELIKLPIEELVKLFPCPQPPQEEAA